jgi:hypothetical protein
MSAVYRIPDEPLPSRWSVLAVHPLWPLLAVMLGGFWFSLPWLVLNSFAIGSPDRKRQLGLAGFALVGAAALTFAVVYLAGLKILTGLSIRFGVLALTLWKLTFVYLLFSAQMRSFSLYEYYGGAVRTGAFALLAAFALSSRVQDMVPAFWFLVLR